MKRKQYLQKFNRFFAAMTRKVQAALRLFSAAVRNVSRSLGEVRRRNAFFGAKGNMKPLPFGALRAKAAGVSVAIARGMQGVAGFFRKAARGISSRVSGGRKQKAFFEDKSNRKPLPFGALLAKSAGISVAIARGIQEVAGFFRKAARGVSRLFGGRKRRAFFEDKSNREPLFFGGLRAKAAGVSVAIARGMQKVAGFFCKAARNISSRLGEVRRRNAFFGARGNMKPLPFGALRAKAEKLSVIIARVMQRAKEIAGAVIQEFSNRYGGGYKPAGFIAAVIIVIAAACALPALAGKSEAALTVKAFNPQPAVLYYPWHPVSPKPDYIKAREIEALYGAEIKEEDNKTAPKPEAELVRAAAPKKKMTAQQMFKEEFPRESYSKTKKILARVIHGEGKGTKSITNRAAIAETILNRVDAKMRGDTPYECATAHGQFCVSGRYTKEELWIAGDVLERWLKIRRGEDAGWILPKSYLWFHGTYPRHDWTVFRNKYHFRDHPRYKTPLHSKIYGD